MNIYCSRPAASGLDRPGYVVWSIRRCQERHGCAHGALDGAQVFTRFRGWNCGLHATTLALRWYFMTKFTYRRLPSGAGELARIVKIDRSIQDIAYPVASLQAESAGQAACGLHEDGLKLLDCSLSCSLSSLVFFYACRALSLDQLVDDHFHSSTLLSCNKKLKCSLWRHET